DFTTDHGTRAAGVAGSPKARGDPTAVSVLRLSRLASVPTPVERFARVSTKRSLTALHSEAITEYTAESRSRPSSPGAHDIDQLRNTPSNVAPSASIARRDLPLRASVLR